MDSDSSISVEEFLRDLVAERGEIARDFAPTAFFRRDLSVDSLAMIEVIVECEKHFSITIPEERFPDFNCLANALKLIGELRTAKM